MPTVSFEVFPPRTPEAEQRLWKTLERLAPLEPSFVSVTCGAAGSAREATLEAVSAIAGQAAFPVAGHLTCAGRTREEIRAEIARYDGAGVRHIVALRGDPVGGGVRFEPHPGGYESSVELVAAIRAAGPFEISVAAYPEPHPDSISITHDVGVLARKADAGATRAITQFCFDTGAIVDLRDRLDRAGIDLKLVPGIMLATSFDGLARMSKRAGISLPVWLADRFAGLEDDLETRRLVGAIVAAEQVDLLRREGFMDFHFYTLNQGDLAPALCRMLNAPQPREPETVI